jgi:hypothetical protein
MVHSGLYSKILSTALFQKMISNIDNKLKNISSRQKLSLFSGHDTNVSPTLTFLNISSFECIESRWKK